MPWAGLLAALLLLAADLAVGVMPAEAWRALARQIGLGPETSVERQRAVQAARLVELRGSRPPVLGFGSSQTAAILDVAPDCFPGRRHVSLAMPASGPIELTGLAHRVGPGPGLFLVGLSPLDTHRQRPWTAGRFTGPPGAVLQLLLDTPTSGVIRGRTAALQLIAGATSNLYSFRQVFRAAGPLRWLRFARSPRLAASQDSTTPNGQRPDGRFPEQLAVAVRSQEQTLEGLRLRPHAALLLRHLARAVAHLRDAGWTVVAFETPLHPEARTRYDRSIDEDLRSSLRALERRGALDRFVELAELPEPPPADYKDLVHLNRRGGAAFCRALGQLLVAEGVGPAERPRRD